MTTDVLALQELPPLDDERTSQANIVYRPSRPTIVCTICSVPSLETEAS